MKAKTRKEIANDILDLLTDFVGQDAPSISFDALLNNSDMTLREAVKAYGGVR